MYNEYEEDDYNYNDGFAYSNRNYSRKSVKKKVVNKNNNYKRKIIIGVIVLSVIISALVIINYFNSYGYFEKVMVDHAKAYIKNNSLTIRDKIYLDIDKIGLEPKEGCTLLSGVIVDSEGVYTPYLNCTDYETEIIKNDDTVVTLNGHVITAIPKGIPYYDAGVSYGDAIVVGRVGTEEGVYDLTYSVMLNGTNHTLQRMVIVTDNSYVRTLYPSIYLKGDAVERTIRGYDYVDKGASANDNVDGDLQEYIEGVHNIDPNVAGEYEYVYMVTNSRGYTNMIKRKVVVVENYTNTIVTATVAPETMTNQDVKISLNIFGNSFQYIVLPDHQIKTDNMIDYNVSKNGDYSFLALDNDGKSISKIVHIDNIDKEPPTGTCFAQVYPKYADIQVSQTSNKKISGYNFIVDGKESGYLNSVTYRMINNNSKTVNVKIKDTIGNVGDIPCTVKYMDPSIGNNKIKYYVYNGVEYVIANTPNDLKTFEQLTCHKISQDADIPNCGNLCLSFSLYHASFIQYGNMYRMNQEDACSWHYTGLAHIDTRANKTKKDALKMVYDAILSGSTPVLQVSAVRTRDHRHFFLVVGYRRSKYTADDLIEDDLLCIDSWSGCFATLSYEDLSKRTMYNNHDGLGYRVDFMVGNKK